MDSTHALHASFSALAAPSRSHQRDVAGRLGDPSQAVRADRGRLKPHRTVGQRPGQLLGDLQDRLRVVEHRDDDLGVTHGAADRPDDMHSVAMQRLCLVPCPVPRRDVQPGPSHRPCHRRTHSSGPQQCHSHGVASRSLVSTGPCLHRDSSRCGAALTSA